MKWISVDERLPEKTTRVLVHLSNGFIEAADYLDTEKIIKDAFIPDLINPYYDDFITHWMPLPQPPGD